jgi:hypothetical protein
MNSAAQRAEILNVDITTLAVDAIAAPSPPTVLSTAD